jgi:hypothetical protein
LLDRLLLGGVGVGLGLPPGRVRGAASLDRLLLGKVGVGLGLPPGRVRGAASLDRRRQATEWCDKPDLLWARRVEGNVGEPQVWCEPGCRVAVVAGAMRMRQPSHVLRLAGDVE